MPANAINWLDESACRGVDPETFFPGAEPGPARDAQTAAAKRVCGGCPVRTECLEWATDNLAYGVAGGLDVAERRVLRRMRAEVSA